MNAWFWTLAINLAFFGAAAVFFLWTYWTRVGRQAKLRVFQYSLFALRDRAISLVASDVMKEDDPEWRRIYDLLNESARPATVDKMRSGLTFVTHLLSHARPLPEDVKQRFTSLPDPAKAIVRDYVATVFRICLEGSVFLRFMVDRPRLFLWFAKRRMEGFSMTEKDSLEHFRADATELDRLGLAA